MSKVWQDAVVPGQHSMMVAGSCACCFKDPLELGHLSLLWFLDPWVAADFA